jgi:RNA polymerase sigma-70 factor (ECF subfamily)
LPFTAAFHSIHAIHKNELNGEDKMATINLRDFYPWYTHDVFVEVSEEVAAELYADKRYHKAHDRRMKRNRAYSLDIDADMETAATAIGTDNPEVIFEMMERHCRLCRALNSLPETQGRRVEAHYLLGKSIAEIAEADGTGERNVRKAISRGLDSMKKFLINFQKQGTETACK